MTIVEHNQVFIVRVWWEAREIAGREPEWRAVVEHVGSGQRRYATELGEIARFIGHVCHMPSVSIDRLE